jgi:hypothetical protein
LEGAHDNSIGGVKVTTILSIQQLKKRYKGGTTALDGIDLQVKEKEFIDRSS